MIKYGSWDLPGLDYFQSKNSFKGSRGNLRFVIEPGEKLKVYCWHEDVCFELAKDITEKEFEFSEQSLYDINEYLTAEHKSIRDAQ